MGATSPDSDKRLLLSAFTTTTTSLDTTRQHDNRSGGGVGTRKKYDLSMAGERRWFMDMMSGHGKGGNCNGGDVAGDKDADGSDTDFLKNLTGGGGSIKDSRSSGTSSKVTR